MPSLDEMNEANRAYWEKAGRDVRERGGAIYTAFWKGERNYNSHSYDVALRSRLAQYGVKDGCYMIPVLGGDGTGEIANMLETLSRELAEAKRALSDSPDAKDAARYRWLRHRTAAGDAGGGQCVMDFPDIYGKRDWLHGSVAQHLDEALDTLIAREPT